MKTVYVAYGSNMNLEQMSYRCPTARVVGHGLIEGHRLVFRGGHGSAVATIEPHPSRNVPVILWELEKADEEALDLYEGWPHLYRKETVKVKIFKFWLHSGEVDDEVQAMVYLMNEGRPLGIPGMRYYNTILDGYRSAGFQELALNKAVRDSSVR